jgi:quercetin dioxygenase-like cupin family protein
MLQRRIALVVLVLGVLASSNALATPGSEAEVTPLGGKTVKRVNIRMTEPSAAATVRVTIHPGGYTGWHSHPSWVFVAIESGEVTLTHAACHETTVGAGGMFVERPGRAHNVTNNGTEDAVLIATFVGISPPDAAARIDEPDPCTS